MLPGANKNYPLMIKLKFLAVAMLGLSLPTASLAQNQNHPPEKIAAAMMNLNASVLRSQQTGQSSHNNLWGRMRQDFRMSEVNPEIVRRHENYFTTRGAYFNRTIERSRPYLYHILSEVEKRNMPAEIALLPFIESAFVTKARSQVGASGLWQFMPATGREYGLAQNHLYDARHDVYAATDAALNYLQHLHGLFGDWSLALAAYNWGQGNVSRAITRARSQGLEPIYENLRMPDETRNYVPKLLAVRNLVNNPQVFGLNLSNIENKPYFQAVTISSPMDINAITRLANISPAEFEALNPSAKVPVFLPEDGQRKLLLPVGAVNAFERNLRDAPQEALLSYDILHTQGATSLSDIAERTGTSVDDLRRTNGLSRNSIGSGNRILVSRSSSTAARLVSGNSAQDDPLGGLIRQAVAAESTPSGTNRPIQVSRISESPAARTSPNTAAAPRNTTPATTTSTTPTPAAAVATASNSTTASTNITRTTPAQAASTTDAPPPANASVTTSNQSALAALAAPATTPAASEQPTATAGSAATDPLMALAAGRSPAPETDNDTSSDVTVSSTNVQADAAASVRASLAQTEAEENRRLASARAAAERSARQQETQSRNSQRAQTAATTHKVQVGDTLSSIARRYNIDTATLRNTNNLSSNNIRVGQVLRLNSASGNQTAARGQTQNARNAQTARAREASYTVRSGDTLQSIARRHNMSVNDLKRTNNLRNDTLRPGQKLRLRDS